MASKDGSIATAIFQTSCRIGYAIGLAVATLIQVNVESRALRSGASDIDALAKGLSAAFWFCGACAASGEHLEPLISSELILQVPWSFYSECVGGRC